jgi:hypothetical protein
MVEYYSGLAGAVNGEGVKVICKVYLKRSAMAAKEEHQHVGTKRPAMAAEELRNDRVVEDVGNLATPLPDVVDGAAGTFQETAWLQPHYGGAFIKMEEPRPLVMVRPNGEVLRFSQPAATVDTMIDSQPN